MVPLPVGLGSELSQGAAESLQQMQEAQARKQEEWLHDGELARYAIRGSEEEWESALGKSSAATPPKSIGVKASGGVADKGAKAKAPKSKALSSQKKKRPRQ